MSNVCKNNNNCTQFVYSYRQTRGLYKVSAICVCTAIYGRVANITDLFYYINPNKMHMLQSLFYLTTALHISGVAITYLPEHKQL
jgi:hypothetical protein